VVAAIPVWIAQDLPIEIPRRLTNQVSFLNSFKAGVYVSAEFFDRTGAGEALTDQFDVS